MSAERFEPHISSAERPKKRFRYAPTEPSAMPPPASTYADRLPEPTSATLAASMGSLQAGTKDSMQLSSSKRDAHASFLTRFAGPSTTKAGLKRDPQEVERIIYDASIGSKYFENEQRKARETEAQVRQVVVRLQRAVDERRGDLSNEEAQVEKIAANMELSRVLDETIVVVDADAFVNIQLRFLLAYSLKMTSVEELDDPSLKGKAFGVGQGVLTTASYEARKWGVRSAMAGFVAKKLCPHLIFVQAHFNRYYEYSQRIMSILREYDPNMASASLDEAYLNITAFLKSSGVSPAAAVEQMRLRIHSEIGLTVSAGVAANRTLAKIAADVNKPNGQCVVPPTREDAMNFMRHLPIRKIPGVGRVTEHWLSAVSINKVADVWPQRGRLLLCSSLDSTSTLSFLLQAHLGLGSTLIEPARREDRKSVGREDTFQEISKAQDLYDKLHEIVTTLAEDLQRLQYSGRTITLKLKLNTYECLTRAFTAGSNTYLSRADDLLRVGKQLLEKEIAERHAAWDASQQSGRPVKGCYGQRDMTLRLLGLRVTNLRDERLAAETRAARGSLDDWARKDSQNATAIMAVSRIPTDEEQNTATEGSQDANIVPRDKSHVLLQRRRIDNMLNELQGAECPVCGRRWARTSQELLEAHVEDCVRRVTTVAQTATTAEPGDAFSKLMKAAKLGAKGSRRR